MADMLSGGAVGVGLQELLRAFLLTIDKGRDFRPTLERNKDTLDALSPLLELIKKFNNELEHPTEVVERLENGVRTGKELVNKCSKLPWWRFFSYPWYRDRLMKSDQRLQRFISMELQIQMARDLKEILYKERQILEILMKQFGGGSGMMSSALGESDTNDTIAQVTVEEEEPSSEEEDDPEDEPSPPKLRPEGNCNKPKKYDGFVMYK